MNRKISQKNPLKTRTGYATPLLKTFQKLLITLRMSSKALTKTYAAWPDLALVSISSLLSSHSPSSSLHSGHTSFFHFLELLRAPLHLIVIRQILFSTSISNF